ncbi:Cd2+/Zn2+-exporting ATPase [Roseateles sp. YR242]|uniref:heavy metal translocating P-type ATPase n=1 Tax=Roseateles sp. YR242 TaxID=1855305 RepID=UPI0008C1BFC9|nr:cation-translocating P-type ATPase [Roseateles sp. YR242]SEL27368.1 Cd2+/Zn2+-exporting ATPase [Roseateles sp. YR242]
MAQHEHTHGPQVEDHTHPHDHSHGHDHGHHHHAHEGGACCGGPAPAAVAPSAPAAPTEPELAGTNHHRYFIAGMDCPTEEGLLRRRLQRQEGVVALQFDLINRILDIHHRLPDDAALRAAIADTGMRPEPMARSAPPPAAQPAISTSLRWRMAAAGLAAVAAEALAFAGWNESGPLVIALALATMLLGGLPTLRKGWIALRSFTLNIHLLMSLAVIGAVALGQWPEAAMVVWLFGLSEMIESLSLSRARDAIRALAQLAPETAWLQTPDGQFARQPVEQVSQGAVLRVPPGERVPLDGTVTQGRSSLNEAALTGEAMPVDKAPGDPLLAGSVNGDGLLLMQVTSTKGHTLLDRMAQAVQQAQSQRAPSQAFIDRFAAVYTPAVVLLALALAVLPPLLGWGGWHEWLYKGLVLLVIACPCALVISTPVTIVSGLAAAARRGILIKGGLYLERVRQLRTLALDKTGTLTEGRPNLVTVQSLDPSLHADDALHLAASLDAGSAHPLAQAIVAAQAERPGRALAAVAHLQNHPGLGVIGQLDQHRYALGNERLAEQQGAMNEPARAAAAALQAQGHTLVWLMRDHTVLALLALADTPRPAAAATLAALKARGLSLVMLSGDHRASAQAMAARLGLPEAAVHAPLLPQDKLDAVASLSAQGPVGMVGDGVNDAPAMARADIAIAMGAAGSATALETADIALMRDDLTQLPALLDLSRRTARVLTQNIVVALGLKVVVAALTLAGLGSLWLAVLADAGASLLVVLNGLRLLREERPAS